MRGSAFAVLAVSAGCTSASPDVANTPIGLYVYASVTPAVMSISDSAAMLQVRIIAKNVSDEQIIVVTGNPPVKITPDPTNGTGLEYSYRISWPEKLSNAGPPSDSWGRAVDTFPAHVGFAMDFQLTLATWRVGKYALDTGTYTLRSFYNGHEGDPTTFRLVP